MKFIANPVEVEAFEIFRVATCRDNPHDGQQTCRLMLIEPGSRERLDPGELITDYLASPEMTARYWPKAGDYLVRQADGYEYLNPKEVFERKYANLSDSMGQADAERLMFFWMRSVDQRLSAAMDMLLKVAGATGVIRGAK